MATVAAATAMVDGVTAEPVRIRSSRFVVDGTVFGAPQQPLVAASDGYWLLLRLNPGVHHITTSAVAGTFAPNTDYTITAI